jgi:hypothetical protein
MTTHELARILLEGPDLMVTVRGYEGGVDEITTINPPAPIHLEVWEGHDYCGRHEYHDEDNIGWCMVCGNCTQELLDVSNSQAIHLSR